MNRALAMPLVVAALFASPAGALAQAGASDPSMGGPGAALARFELKGHDGYSAFVEGAGDKVKLTISYGGSSARYTVRGTTSTRRVRARFGHLGRISVRFESTGAVKMMWPPMNCNGYPVPGERGVFSGTVRFRGEGGYVELDAARALGKTARFSRWSCGSDKGLTSRMVGSDEDSDEEGEEAGSYARLWAATPGDRRSFTAVGSKYDVVGLPFLGARMVERRGSIQVVRETYLTGPAQSFSFDPGLTSAVVQPPEPFQGEGAFQLRPDGSRTWTGSLSVSFLGREDVALAGPRFDPQLVPGMPGD
jgi:hypothetical protein